VLFRSKVDGEEFSHAETGTGDYYNNPHLPTTPFQTPFGGAPRADLKSSYGYNTFVRTRILDDIPFTNQLRFDMELAGRKTGSVDYASTIFWYGDNKTRPQNISRPDVWARTLLPSPASESVATDN
jgi:hypothetical protein